MWLLYILFSLIYVNQGFYSLPGLSTFYLMKEGWGLTVTKMSIIGSILTLPWIIKPLYGFISDTFPIFGHRRKPYLLISYLVICLTGIYIYIMGLTFISYVIIGLLIGIMFASSDVLCDAIMVENGQKYNLTGKFQSIQWGSIEIAAILTGVLGGLIAKYLNYQYAYLFTVPLPLITFLFLLKYYKEERVTKVNTNTFKAIQGAVKNKQLWLGIIFLFLLYFSPSFGIALMFKMVDTLKFDKIFLGILSSTGAIFGILGTVIYFLICKKFKIKKLLFYSTLVAGLTTFAYLYFPNKSIALIYTSIFGITGMLCHLTILDFCARVTPKEIEGTVFALIMSVLNLGSMGSNLLGGYLYSLIGLQWLIVISGITTLLCLPLLRFIHLGNLKNGYNAQLTQPGGSPGNL